MSVDKILKASLIVQRNGLRNSSAQVGKFPGSERADILADLKQATAALGAGRAVTVNSLHLSPAKYIPDH